MSEFSLGSDWKDVDWRSTVRLNAMRAAAAGFILGTATAPIYLLATDLPLQMRLLALFMPLLYAAILPVGLPFYIGLAGLFRLLDKMAVPFVGWIPPLFALIFAVGDPVLFYLHRRRPDLVPVDQPRFFSLALVLFVRHADNWAPRVTAPRAPILDPAVAASAGSPPAASHVQMSSPPVIPDSSLPACKKCARQVVPGAKFCRFCGTSLRIDPLPAPLSEPVILAAVVPEVLPRPDPNLSLLAPSRPTVKVDRRIPAGAAAIVALLGGGWFGYARLSDRGPTKEEIASRFAGGLPPFLTLSSFDAEPPQKVQQRAQSAWKTPFRSTVVVTADTFEKSADEDGRTFLLLHSRQGVAIPVTGFATSIRNGSSWTTEVAIPDGTLNGLGAPKASFGNSTLIIGSGEEIAFRQQQQQHRDEGAQRLAQIEADRLAAEQLRIHEGRKELQRQKAQTQLALEREREATVAQARQEKAREEAERLDAERASREAAERDRVQRAAIPKEAAIVSGELRKGTEVSVRLSAAVSSATAKVEDRFDAVIVDDVMLKGQRLVPAGSQMRGVVSAAEPAGRVHRTGRMTLAFDQLTIAGRSYPIRARVTKALSGSGVRDAKKVGVGAGIGAVIGGILGGAKGALAGLAIGGGGTMAATEGSDVSLAPGAVLRVKLDAAVDIR